MSVINEGESLDKMFVGKFYGPEKIASIEVIDMKTPSGAHIFQITTESERKYLVPQKAMIVITDEMKDWNFVRDTKVQAMVPEMANVVAEYDIPHSQIVYMAAILGQHLSNHFNRAHNFLWTGDDRNYVPGYDPLNDITLLGAERINQQIPARDEIPSPYHEIAEPGDTSE